MLLTTWAETSLRSAWSSWGAVMRGLFLICRKSPSWVIGAGHGSVGRRERGKGQDSPCTSTLTHFLLPSLTLQLLILPSTDSANNGRVRDDESDDELMLLESRTPSYKYLQLQSISILLSSLSITTIIISASANEVLTKFNWEMLHLSSDTK